MTTAQTRESRSVRLSQDEWDLAEAISLLNHEGGAGAGLRRALDLAENYYTELDGGVRLDAIRAELVAKRTAGGER